MNSIKMFSAALLVFFVSAVMAAENLPDCKMTEKDFDNCAAEVTGWGDRNMIVPTNDAEMDAYCNKSFKALSCLRTYTRTCMANFPKTVSGIFLYDAKRYAKRKCTTKAGREEYISHMKCGQPPSRLEPLHQCIDNYIVQLEWMLKNVKKDDLLISSCCALHQTHECFKTRAGELCESITGPDTKQYFDEVIANIITEGVDYTCGIYKDIDACHKNLKEEIWKPLFEVGKDAKKSGVVSQHRSPFTLAVQLFTSVN